MKLLSNVSNQKERFIFLIIFSFSALLYLFNINYSDISIDETFTVALIKHSPNAVLGLIKNDFHPPLYFLGLKIFTSIVGISTFTIRLFSIIGVLSTLILAYVVGQKVFGKKGALYFCILLMSLPMLAFYSHIARMYTWATFSITGVFLYSYLFIITNKKSDLVLLILFTIISAYTHYFALIAAFGSNMFVFVYLLFKQNKSWRLHFIAALIIFILYLPWLFVILEQTSKAQGYFWIPKVSWRTILSCFIEPFSLALWISRTSYILIAIIYGLTIVTIYRNFIKRNENNRLVLGLSMFIFIFTVLFTTILSLISQPILLARYIMPVVTMLMIAPLVFFITSKNKWLKGILLGLIFCFGLYIIFKASYSSERPYKQTVEYLKHTYPNVRKIIHLHGSFNPMLEYNENGYFDHYLLKNNKTKMVENVDVFDVFDKFHVIKSLDEALYKDDFYSLVWFPHNPNVENRDLIFSKSHILKVDTIRDYKCEGGRKIILYMLKYKGEVE